jgi:transposase
MMGSSRLASSTAPSTASAFAPVSSRLAPTFGPGDLVIMDNLGAHKLACVRTAIGARGAKLRYLPPCSPDLNPIEQVFAKLKAVLCTAATRTLDVLWHAIGHAFDAFPPPISPTTLPRRLWSRLVGPDYQVPELAESILRPDRFAVEFTKRAARMP